MKIKHYRAPDMRQALRQVREAQGPDAVIVSSRRISGGVEVVAAVDYDAGPEHNDAPSLPSPASGGGWGGGAEPTTLPEFPEAHGGMNEELRTLRRMLETQLATLAWNDLSRRAPTQTELLKQLTVLGLAQDLATELVTQLPARLELSEAYRLSLALLARRIETTGERWLETGGVVALIGATGVGKTTLMAKLAARWVLRHGQRDIAVISTDSVRIGAHDQIHTLGRLLGVPAYAAEGPQALPELLDQLADKRLVLIDTAGLSQRDPTLATELSTLIAASDRLETALVI
ncbi:MAG: flagellar biosynthesis protein FlhF, partial [Steroidobacteraceae bacterium]